MKRTLLLLLALLPLATLAAERKPNFLFVYTDDQRWDAMGVVQREEGEHGRFPWFQTPNMDRLAAEGVRFRNAFVTLSLCAPSRAAFLTGRYNHLNGVANNHTPFPTDSVTHASLMRTAGYTTAYIGKWHMGGQHGQRPGFDYSASFVGQGKYFDCPFEINGQITPTTGWVDDVSTEYAIQFIKQHRDKPFSVVVGFKACHGPCQPPDRAKDRFPDPTARPVPNLNIPAIYRVSATATADESEMPAVSRPNATGNYFRCISAADDDLGRLLKTLDDLGLANDTVVVFCSDNGYYRGEHRLGDKRSAYDESLRIPMLVRYPKLFPKGKVLDQMVLNIDIAPTFLDLAGLPVPAEMQGRSWRPLLTGKSSEWRKAFLAEYFLENQYPSTPTLLALRTDDAKLIKYPGHEEWTELFDLAHDPYETKNLASDPPHKDLLAKMQTEFDQQARLSKFSIPDYADKPGSGDQTVGKKSGKRKRSKLVKVDALAPSILGQVMRKAFVFLFALLPLAALAAAPRLNVLFLTADDMNYDTPGFTGCRTPGITPNLDRLASQGIWFVNAHVTVAVCQPSRECLMTGRYPHRNGATGFYPVGPDVPTLAEALKAAGYQIGIMAKIPHLKPDSKFPWDHKYPAEELGQGRDPALYYRSAKEFFSAAKQSGKPFFLMANSQDPHRPWAGSDAEKSRADGKLGKKKKAKRAAGGESEEEAFSGEVKYPSPNRTYKAEEVAVPGFLPDLPDVRKEMAQYYSSAHRCDESLGEVLRALKESGLEDSTLVVFLSDNGISQPFAKSNCYLTSTRTPWLVRWPGKIKPGLVDTNHFISGIDFMPTVLEAAGVPAPAGMDGRSFLPLLKGEQQAGRDRVFTCYNDTSGRRSFPMRCLQTKRFGYISNAWSDGKTRYQSEPMNGLTFKAMQRAAPEQKSVAERVELLLHRVPEELYDFAADPDALHNLVADPKFHEQLVQMRQEMLRWMEQTQDPLAETFRARIANKAQP